MELRYGLNPQQPAHAAPVRADRQPVRLLHGQPSFINLLDALNAWQLVREASQQLGRPVAASFKHVSPAGVATAGPVDEVTAGLFGAGDDALTDLTRAYLRARDADPKSSYGDFAAVSHPVDTDLAELLTRVVCDGIVAPGYLPGGEITHSTVDAPGLTLTTRCGTLLRKTIESPSSSRNTSLESSSFTDPD